MQDFCNLLYPFEMCYVNSGLGKVTGLQIHSLAGCVEL